MKELELHVVSLVGYSSYLKLMYAGCVGSGEEDTAEFLKDIIDVYDVQVAEVKDIIERMKIINLN